MQVLVFRQRNSTFVRNLQDEETKGLDVQLMKNLNRVWELPWWPSGKQFALQCRGHRFAPCLGRFNIPQDN